MSILYCCKLKKESKLRTVFIINPKSGTPKYVNRVHYMIRKYFGVNNHDINIIKSRQPGHVKQIAERSAAEGYDMVVAVGGDGTVNETARGLINTDTALGVLPRGSGNGYASNMGLPRRLEPALKVLREPAIRVIDVGKVNEHFFLVSCGLGWEAVIATLFEDSKIRGVLPYPYFAVTTYLQYEPQKITIDSEPGNWHYSGRPMMLTVANMKEYGLGAAIAPKAVDNDGMLDICLIPRKNLLDTAKYTPEFFKSRADMVPGYKRRLATEITITRSLPGNIHVDGTPVPAGEIIKFKILPAALKVAVKAE